MVTSLPIWSLQRASNMIKYTTHVECTMTRQKIAAKLLKFNSGERISTPHGGINLENITILGLFKPFMASACCSLLHHRMK